MAKKLEPAQVSNNVVLPEWSCIKYNWELGSELPLEQRIGLVIKDVESGDDGVYIKVLDRGFDAKMLLPIDDVFAIQTVCPGEDQHFEPFVLGLPESSYEYPWWNLYTNPNVRSNHETVSPEEIDKKDFENAMESEERIDDVLVRFRPFEELIQEQQLLDNALKRTTLDIVEMFDKAKNLIYGQREKDYGSATKNFSNIAKMWSVLLDKEITEEQVVQCMIALKQCRLINTPDHEDSWLDIMGYVGIIEKLQKGL